MTSYLPLLLNICFLQGKKLMHSYFHKNKKINRNIVYVNSEIPHIWNLACTKFRIYGISYIRNLTYVDKQCLNLKKME